MSTLSPVANVSGDVRKARGSSVLPLLFGLTILASACLLFLVQPLASKLILPWFGGSAAVWITCMLFFQSGLLLGYLYAHGLARRVPPRRQWILHCVLLLVGVAALPILPNARWQPRPGEDPTWRLLAVLATSVGLPYLILSSTSPLLQSWYARSSRGALPYRYFALSNAGSLVALLAYPVLVEPHLTGHQQAWMWSGAFMAFVILCIVTTVLARDGDPEKSSGEPSSAQSAAGFITILLWLALAACASTLLLAVTNLLTQNIAPMPLLWVVPLSIYLLTFILCFESGRWYKRYIFLPLVLPALGCLSASQGALDNDKISVMVPLFCAALFVCCMACHGELARLKPPPVQLTSFYLSLSAGGAVGGLFVALFAPHFFSAMYEYPVAFISCAALLLIVLWRERKRWTNRRLGLSLWALAATASVFLTVYTIRVIRDDLRNATFMARNFYGALRVDTYMDGRQKIRQLSHGTITHGIQYLNPNLRHQPTTYYGFDSGIGLTYRVLQRQGPIRMGVVGLGAGTVAAYGRAGDTIRFYDINPLVVQIAKTQFTYLSDCPAHIDIVLGDARLSMARESSQQFDILVVDAFSGDAIPVHLLTREAYQIYWRHLKPDGVLAVHVSNRYLNLTPVVELAARQAGRKAWLVENEDDDPHEVFSSSYVLVSNRPGFFEDPLFSRQLLAIDIPPRIRPWTDDYSNLWQVLDFKGGS